MSREELARHISIDPNVCFGRPVIRGTRIWVSLILNYLATGATTETVLQEYPQITAEGIRACLAYAALLVQGHEFEVPSCG